MTEVVLTRLSAGNGKRWAHVISLLLAGVLAIVAYRGSTHGIFMTFWFGYFAFTNYQVLQMLHRLRPAGGLVGVE